jgi:hypothetical protein
LLKPKSLDVFIIPSKQQQLHKHKLELHLSPGKAQNIPAFVTTIIYFCCSISCYHPCFLERRKVILLNISMSLVFSYSEMLTSFLSIWFPCTGFCSLHFRKCLSNNPMLIDYIFSMSRPWCCSFMTHGRVTRSIITKTHTSIPLEQSVCSGQGMSASGITNSN